MFKQPLSNFGIIREPKQELAARKRERNESEEKREERKWEREASSQLYELMKRMIVKLEARTSHHHVKVPEQGDVDWSLCDY